eukprot:scaffold3639_cov141-Isochrysis_galbana.AAC.17
MAACVSEAAFPVRRQGRVGTRAGSAGDTPDIGAGDTPEKGKGDTPEIGAAGTPGPGSGGRGAEREHSEHKHRRHFGASPMRHWCRGVPGAQGGGDLHTSRPSFFTGCAARRSSYARWMSTGRASGTAVEGGKGSGATGGGGRAEVVMRRGAGQADTDNGAREHVGGVSGTTAAGSGSCEDVAARAGLEEV